MPRDNRKKLRRRVTTSGYVYTLDGWPVGECKTLDVSDTGAKLLWASDEEVPPEFILSLSPDGMIRRRCQVKWHEGQQIGVQFVVA
jgi:hypothetical protein